MGSVSTLKYVAPDGGTQNLSLMPGVDTTIGRHPKCTLTVSQPSVSRRHARIWCEAGQWFVEDLKSSNGTFINNDRITKGSLQEGDAIRCGDFELQYVQEAEESTRAMGRQASSTPVVPRVVGKLASDQGVQKNVMNRPTVELDEDTGRNAAAEAAAASAAAAELGKLKDEVDRWKARVATANADKEAVEREMESLRTDMESTSDKLKSTQSEIKILAMQAKEQTKIETELEASRDRIKELESTNSDLSGEIERLKTEAGDSGEMEGLNEQLKELESDLKIARGSQTQFEETSKEQQGQIGDLEAALKVAEGGSKKQKRQISDLEAALQTAEASAQEHLGQINELDAALKAARETGAMTPVSKIETKVGDHDVGSIAETARDLSEDLDEFSQELRKSIKLSGVYLADLAPVIDAAEALRKKGLPKSVSAALRNAIEDSDGAATMDLAQAAIDDASKSARGLRRIARLFRESIQEGSEEG